MGRVKTWTQCCFKRGNSFTQAWIDSKGAKVGNLVEMLTLDGKFWKVTAVGHTVNVLPPFTFENNI